jgi:hypothetical protein
MIPYVSDASSTITSSCPTGSRRRGRGARDSGTNSAVSAIAATPTGTLIQKIERQPAQATSTPPSTGPTARLSPFTPAHTPIARARSRGSVKTFATMDSATGLSIDPPIACSARNATSSPIDGAIPHSSEPRLNSASPVWNVRRRPIRSAVEPDSMSRLASTRVYASIVHCRLDTDAPNSWRIDGSARFTIVLSSPTMNRLRQQIARTARRRTGCGTAVVRPGTAR